jgi:bifunctional non-homologous end joining protein LigD
MLATLVDAPFHRPGWVWEEKYDGIRLIALKDGRRVRLITRNDKDRTADFPEVVAALAALPAATLVLDGEAVILDTDGVSRFQLLQRRGAGTAASLYVAFDCLHARGRDLTGEPLTTRRAALEAEVVEGPRLRVARRLPDDGLRAFAEARRLGLEGVIGKDPRAPYRPGERSPAWCKVKVRAEEEFVVGGFTAPQGGRRHLGALLVGARDDAGLRYAGKVGTGFTEATLADLAARLTPLRRAQSPFTDAPRERDVTWVEPRLVAQLAFTEWTGDGKLRHPTFLGLRHDKSAREVRWTGPRGVPDGVAPRVNGEGLGGGTSSAPSHEVDQGRRATAARQSSGLGGGTSSAPSHEVDQGRRTPKPRRVPHATRNTASARGREPGGGTRRPAGRRAPARRSRRQARRP